MASRTNAAARALGVIVEVYRTEQRARSDRLTDFDEIGEAYGVIDLVSHGGAASAQSHNGVAAFEGVNLDHKSVGVRRRVNRQKFLAVGSNL